MAVQQLREVVGVLLDVHGQHEFPSLVRGAAQRELLDRYGRLEPLSEGVETAQQRQFLKEHHCHYAQGYLLSKPVPAAEIERRFLKRADASNLVPFPKSS